MNFSQGQSDGPDAVIISDLQWVGDPRGLLLCYVSVVMFSGRQMKMSVKKLSNWVSRST